MSQKLPAGMKVNVTTGVQIREVEKRDGVWRLEIPPGSSNRYRLAQLDDYRFLQRRAFPWAPPFRLSLNARSSSKSVAGTWGFGLWNDPFSMSVVGGVGGLRIPVLPNAAWFFFASPSNYLSLQDNIPAQGWLASTFRSPLLPSAFSMLLAPALPFLLFPPCVRFIRRLLTRFVYQDAVILFNDPTAWCSYELVWKSDSVDFRVNGELVLQTLVTPTGSLGLVIWVDNQYAAVLPSGRMRYGFLAASEPTWIEIEQLSAGQI